MPKWNFNLRSALPSWPQALSGKLEELLPLIADQYAKCVRAKISAKNAAWLGDNEKGVRHCHTYFHRSPRIDVLEN